VNASHPIWHTIDRIALPVIVIGVIWANASNFDKGEMTSIVTILAGSLLRDKFMPKAES